MLSIDDLPSRLCDGIPRRTILRAGTLAAMGTAFPGLLQPGLATANSPVGQTNGAAKSVIVLFLMGGPPQHSTWDPKPLAPANIRGEFAPISTTVPGLQVGELMPQSAQLAEHIAVMRAVVTNDNAHSSSGYFMLTGTPHIPQNVENANPGFPNDWPMMGSIMQHLAQQKRQILPPAIRLPHKIFNTDGSVWPGQSSGWLGLNADPWLFNCQPASPGYDVPEFRLSADVTLDRLSQRRSLLSQFEAQVRSVEDSRKLETFNSRQQQAFELLGAPQARAACDLNLETAETRDRYGRSQFGQSVLLAKRLTEVGVQFVQVNWYRGPEEPSDAPCWDSHTNEAKRLREVLIPPFDQAFGALLTDLKQTGRLDETLIVVMSEFGRSPKINGAAGRDHWGSVFSVAMAGGGVKGGRVVGASDDIGGYPKDRIVHPQDITATIFHTLGLAPEFEITDPQGRPFPISRGEPILEIL